jgi:hypothetical protein
MNPDQGSESVQTPEPGRPLEREPEREPRQAREPESRSELKCLPYIRLW